MRANNRGLTTRSRAHRKALHLRSGGPGRPRREIPRSHLWAKVPFKCLVVLYALRNITGSYRRTKVHRRGREPSPTRHPEGSHRAPRLVGVLAECAKQAASAIATE